MSKSLWKMVSHRPARADGCVAPPLKDTWEGEPALSEVLRDPIVTMVMTRDRVSAEEVDRLAAAIRDRLRLRATGGRPAVVS